MATDGNGRPSPELISEIRAVVARAKAGDEAAVPELRGHLDRHPELWRQYGDAAAQAERAWIALAAGANLHLRECMIRFAEAQRAELTRPSAAPGEKMLVDRVVTCGLQLEYFSAIEANAVGANDPPRVHQWWARRHAQAQRAFQAALSALLTVQKLFPAAASRVDAPVAATEPEYLPAACGEAAPATAATRSCEEDELPAFRSTDWPELTEEHVPAPGLLKVRG